MDLVEVRFEPASAFVLVQPGTTLFEASRLAGVEIATGCTRGRCGTDVVRVAAAAGALEPAHGDERGTLERMGLDAGCRLSCVARVRAGPVRVELGVF